MKSIVVYFSVSGHTKSVAEMLAAIGNFDITPIVVCSPYTNNSLELEKRVTNELDNGLFPKLDIDMSLFDSYSHIFIGSPVWIGSVAPAVKTFIYTANLMGKTLHPFFTCGGMPLSVEKKTVEVFSGKGAVVTDSLMVEYSHKGRMTKDDVIRQWVNTQKVKYHIS